VLRLDDIAQTLLGLQELTPDAVPAKGLRVVLRNNANLSGMWRYRELMLPSVADQMVTHPEGNPPLLRRPAVAAAMGRRTARARRTCWPRCRA